MLGEGKVVRFVFLAFALLFLMVDISNAAVYKLEVSRLGHNLYKVNNGSLIVKTRYCYEYVFGDDAVISTEGIYPKIIFLGQGKSVI